MPEDSNGWVTVTEPLEQFKGVPGNADTYKRGANATMHRRILIAPPKGEHWEERDFELPRLVRLTTAGIEKATGKKEPPAEVALWCFSRGNHQAGC